MQSTQSEEARQDEEKKNEETDKLKRERDEYLEGWKRAKADLINYKKEEMGRTQSILRFGMETLVRDLIIVLDSFYLCISSMKEMPERKGVEMIRVQFEDVLRRYGLERIDARMGNSLDTASEEAIEEVVGDGSPGTVVEEVEKGYRFQGKVIRPAKVKVMR